jgi:copper(I)-binding protein
MFSAATVHSHSVELGDLEIDHPYALPSLKGVNSSATYFRSINNTGATPDRLIGVSSSISERMEMHRKMLDQGIMRMRPQTAIELPAHTQTQMRHDGQYHLMLLGLKRPLSDGDRFDLTLEFEHAGKITVKVWVQQPHEASDAQHKP